MKAVSWISWLALLVIALALLHFRFGLQILDPTHTNWMLVQCSDGVVGYNGWEHFKDQPWSFPLGKLEGYQYPTTTNIGLTDSVPIMAVLFKLLHPIFSDVDYHFYGIWLCLSFVLQIYFGYRLLQALNVKQPVLLVIGAALFLLSPVFLHRFSHPSLSIHWAILAAFWLYFDAGIAFQKKIKGYFALSAIMAWTHPYAAAMLIGLTVTLLAKIWIIEKRLTWKSAVGLCLGNIALVVTLWWIMGYFNSGSGLSTDNFGFYSANLNSLFNSQDKTNLLPSLPLARKGQYEGFGYLGLGILFAAIFTLLVSWKSLKLKQTAIPIFVLAILAMLYAWSDEWTFNQYTFLKMDYPAFLTKQLRSSGRFIWIAHYLIMAWTIAAISKLRWNSYLKTGLLLLIAAIQFYDVFPLLERQYVRHDGTNFLYSTDLWQPAMEASDRIITYPPYAWEFIKSCDQAKLTHMAAIYDKPITCGRTVYSSSKQKSMFRNYLNTQIDTLQLESERNTLFVSTANSFVKFRPLLEQDIVQTFFWDDYWIYPPNELYNKVKDRYPKSANEMLLTFHPESLISFVSNRKDKTILMSVKDEARHKLSDDFKQYMTERGSKIDQLKFRGSYAAILQQDLVVAEKMSSDEVVNLQKDSIYIESAGRLAGNFSSIKISEIEYSPAKRGINLVVLDKGKVIETINYDTFTSSFHNYGYRQVEQ